MSRIADCGAVAVRDTRRLSDLRNERSPEAPPTIGERIAAQRLAGTDASRALHSSRCALKQNNKALGQNSAITFEQDSSGNHPTAVCASGDPR